MAFSFAHRLAKDLSRSSSKAKQEIGASKAVFAAGVEKIAQTHRAFAVTSDIIEWDGGGPATRFSAASLEAIQHHSPELLMPLLEGSDSTHVRRLEGTR